MIWCDVMWCDAMWCDVIYDMIWYDMIYDMISFHLVWWYDMIWYDMIWYDMMWCDVTWRGVAWRDVPWRAVTWHDMTCHDICIQKRLLNIYNKCSGRRSGINSSIFHCIKYYVFLIITSTLVIEATFLYTVGELRSGVTGFATIFMTAPHRFLLQVRNDERDEINLRQIKRANLTYHRHMYIIISPWNILKLCRTFRRYIATKKQQIVTLKSKKLRDNRQKSIISNFDDNWPQWWACGCRHLSIHLLSVHPCR